MIASTFDPEAALLRLAVERARIWNTGNGWTYAHHPHLAWFAGRFHAIWSNGRRDEDAPGQRVLWSRSADAAAWSAPVVLAAAPPGKGGVEQVLTAAGFHGGAGGLVAYFGQYENDRTATRLCARTSADGSAWGPVVDLGVPVNPNHGPQPTRSGRLILAGNTLFPYTDDPSGLSGWTLAGINPPALARQEDNPATFWRVREAANWPVALCEGAFYQTDDGVLHMLLRSTGHGFRGRLWASESRDDGAMWTTPVETAFPDNDTKFHFGRLPDGRFYYVGTPDPRNPGSRARLVLSLSRDGAVFDRHFLLADEPYAMRTAGRYKHGAYGYPHTLVRDGRLYVIVSRQKEAVEVLSVALEQVG